MTGLPPIHEIHDLTFRWPGTGFGIKVREFELARGDTLFLHGPSGSGKSTLLNAICGIVPAAQGEIRIDGKALAGLRQRERDRLRAEKVGLIFQMFNLIPYLSALDNILLPLRFAPARRQRCADPRADAARLAQDLGLDPGLHMVQAARLSVGQQQRVAVARAMIGAPPLIVADEPTSALDDQAQSDFVDLLFQQVHAVGASLLMVSHDTRLADRFDRRVALTVIAQSLEARA